MLIQGIHFDLTYTPLKHLGYKSVAVNASDIYAMNGIPKQITLSLAVSNHFSVEGLEEFYAGLYLACESTGSTWSEAIRLLLNRHVHQHHGIGRSR